MSGIGALVWFFGLLVVAGGPLIYAFIDFLVSKKKKKKLKGRISLYSVGCSVAMWSELVRLRRLGIRRFPGTGPRGLVRGLPTE